MAKIVGAAALLAGVFWLILNLQPQSKNTSMGSSQADTNPPINQPTNQLENVVATLPYPAPVQEATPKTVLKTPLCNFPLDIPSSTEIGSSISSYQFSEPEIVYRSESAVEIAGWLPDMERLLIGRSTLNGRQIIETFDSVSQETVIYAERDGEGGMPVWLAEIDAVAYAEFVQDHEELWLSYGDPENLELIAADIQGWSLSGMEGKLIFFSPTIGDQPEIWNSKSKKLEFTPFSLENRAYSKYGPGEYFQPVPGRTFSTAIQPGLKQAVFFGPGLFFLANFETGEVCELDLGIGPNGFRSASDAQWSTDGRFVAMKITSSYPGAIQIENQILVLDLLSGEEYFPEIPVDYVYDFVWEPGHHTLAALGKIGAIDGRAKMGLFLIGVDEKMVRRILPEQIFGGGAIGMLAWGQDKIAINCIYWPDTALAIVEGRVCLIDVDRQP